MLKNDLLQNIILNLISYKKVIISAISKFKNSSFYITLSKYFDFNLKKIKENTIPLKTLKKETINYSKTSTSIVGVNSSFLDDSKEGKIGYYHRRGSRHIPIFSLDSLNYNIDLNIPASSGYFYVVPLYIGPIIRETLFYLDRENKNQWFLRYPTLRFHYNIYLSDGSGLKSSITNIYNWTVVNGYRKKQKTIDIDNNDGFNLGEVCLDKNTKEIWNINSSNYIVDMDLYDTTNDLRIYNGKKDTRTYKISIEDIENIIQDDREILIRIIGEFDLRKLFNNGHVWNDGWLNASGYKGYYSNGDIKEGIDRIPVDGFNNLIVNGCGDVGNTLWNNPSDTNFNAFYSFYDIGPGFSGYPLNGLEYIIYNSYYYNPKLEVVFGFDLFNYNTSDAKTVSLNFFNSYIELIDKPVYNNKEWMWERIYHSA